MDAGLDDDFRVRLRRLAGELQGIADEVGNAVEDLRRHVVVSEHDSAFFALQRIDRRDIGREDGPFDLGHHVTDARIEGSGRGGDFGGVGERFHGRSRYARYEHIYGIKKGRLQPGGTNL
jgi:hypothetical protein